MASPGVSLGQKPRASLEVSLADKTHNAATIVHDLRCHGEMVWLRFTAGRDGSLWYYRALAERFAELVPGTAAERLNRVVAEMEALTG